MDKARSEYLGILPGLWPPSPASTDPASQCASSEDARDTCRTLDLPEEAYSFQHIPDPGVRYQDSLILRRAPAISKSRYVADFPTR